MCQDCPRIPTDDVQQMIQQIKDEFIANEKLIHDLFGSWRKAEETYRSAGVCYHSTQQAVRHSDHFPEESLKRLKQAFETSRVEEYDAIFARWSHIHQDLADVSRIRFKESGIVDKLWHCLKAVYDPALVKLYSQIREATTKFEQLEEEAHRLQEASVRHNYVDENGCEFRWCDLDETFGIPCRVGSEWNTYLAWIQSLPETQRAVEVGRKVDKIALEMLFSPPEECIDF